MLIKRVDYSILKSSAASRAASVQWIDYGEFYWLGVIDGNLTIEAQLNKINDAADVLDFETNLKSAGNKTLQPAPVKNTAGQVVIEQGIRRGCSGTKAMSLVTHDFGDRTSWFQKSIQVVDETLTTSDDLTYSSIKTFWVNFTGATSRLTYQYKTVSIRNPTVALPYAKHADWDVIIKVNDVVVTTGFTINYAAGTITFASAQTGNTVKATYWHNSGVTMPSEFLIVPPPGLKYTVEHVEMQFSKTAQLPAAIRFEIWANPACTTSVTLANGLPGKQVNVAGYAGFPDAYFDAGMGQVRADYRNIRDFINASNEGKGTIPAVDFLTTETLVMPFNYVQAFSMDSAMGTVFRMRIIGDTPFNNAELATATFYLISEPS